MLYARVSTCQRDWKESVVARTWALKSLLTVRTWFARLHYKVTLLLLRPHAYFSVCPFSVVHFPLHGSEEDRVRREQRERSFRSREERSLTERPWGLVSSWNGDGRGHKQLCSPRVLPKRLEIVFKGKQFHHSNSSGPDRPENVCLGDDYRSPRAFATSSRISHAEIRVSWMD